MALVGYDAGKKVKGRKRQVMVDADGRGLFLEPSSRRSGPDGAPFVLEAFADMGFAGERPATAASITIEIVRKPAASGSTRVDGWSTQATAFAGARVEAVLAPHFYAVWPN